MNFFSTLFGVCAGTGIFPELAKRSLWRAVWHFLLMSTLCALIIATGRQSDTTDIVRKAYARLTAYYGELRDSGRGGIEVEKNNSEPSTVRLLTLPIVFCYMPSNTDKLPDNFDEGESGGIVASPTHLVIWGKGPGGQAVLLPATAQTLPQKYLPFSRAAVEELLSEPAASEKIQPEKSTASGLIEMLKSPGGLVFAMLFIAILFIILTTAGSLVAMFSLVFGWFGAQRSGNLVTLREVFVIDIYAGFPAMLVASAFPAFDIGYLNFNLVYSLGLVIYATIAVNRVASSRLPAKPPAPKE
ncbi:MAG: hypothetical protein AB7F40_04690 [Victivallaceae bacterium]|nr:hypothetical protein [Victivallaceae bacterium]